MVWIVDTEQWPRAALRAELIERGYDAAGYIQLGEVLALLRSPRSQDKPCAIILDLRGQEINEEVLQEMSQSKIPTIFLVGTPEVNDPAVRSFKAAAVLRRPVTLGEIADQLKEILARQ